MSPFGGNANTSSTFGTSPFGSASFSGGLRPGVTGAPGAAAGGGALSGSGSAWQAGTSGSQPLALGAAPSQGTGQVAFRPVPSSETTAHGTKQVLFDSIVFMSGFESKSFEELRFEDYQLGNRGQSGPGGSSAPSGTGGGSLFGNLGSSSTTNTGLFGAAKPSTGLTAPSGLFRSDAGTSGAASPFGASAISGTTFGQQQNTSAGSTGGAFGSAPSAGGFGNANATGSGTGFGIPGQNAGQSGGLFGGGVGSSATTSFGSNQAGSGTGAGNAPFGSGLFGSNANARPSPFAGAPGSTTGAFSGFGASAGSNTNQPAVSAALGTSGAFPTSGTVGAPGSGGLGFGGSRPLGTGTSFGTLNATQNTSSLSNTMPSFGGGLGGNAPGSFFGGSGSGSTQAAGLVGGGAPGTAGSFGAGGGGIGGGGGTGGQPGQAPSAQSSLPRFSLGGFGAAQANQPSGQSTGAGAAQSGTSTGGLFGTGSTTVAAGGAPAFQSGNASTPRSEQTGIFGAANQTSAKPTGDLFRFGVSSTGSNLGGTQPGGGASTSGGMFGLGGSAFRPLASPNANMGPMQPATSTGMPSGLGFGLGSGSGSGAMPAFGAATNASPQGIPFQTQPASNASSASPYGPLPTLSGAAGNISTDAERWQGTRVTSEPVLDITHASLLAPLASIPNAPVTSYRVRPRSQVRAFSYGASIGGVPLHELFDRPRAVARGRPNQTPGDSWSSVWTPGRLRQTENGKPERSIRQLIRDAAAQGQTEPTLTLADITTQEAVLASPSANLLDRDASPERTRATNVDAPGTVTPSFAADMSPIVPLRSSQGTEKRSGKESAATPGSEQTPGAHFEYHAQGPVSSGASTSDQGDRLPAWVPRLTKPGYYTKPPLAELQSLDEAALSHVSNFVLGRRHIAEIRFLEPVDLRYANLDQIVQIEPRTIILYPTRDTDAMPPKGTRTTAQQQQQQQQQQQPSRSDRWSGLPPPGQGLNRRALLRFEQVFRMDKRTGKPTNDPQAIERFRQRLQEYAEQQGARFVSYDAETGTWELLVEQFS